MTTYAPSRQGAPRELHGWVLVCRQVITGGRSWGQLCQGRAERVRGVESERAQPSAWHLLPGFCVDPPAVYLAYFPHDKLLAL